MPPMEGRGRAVNVRVLLHLILCVGQAKSMLMVLVPRSGGGHLIIVINFR